MFKSKEESSKVDAGFSLRTAATALLTLAFVKPKSMSAVVASSAIGLTLAWNNVLDSDPSPLTTLSFNSIMSLCALFNPMPLMLLILFTSSAIMALIISSEVSDDSIILAVDAPIPDTPISSLNRLRSAFVAKP